MSVKDARREQARRVRVIRKVHGTWVAGAEALRCMLPSPRARFMVDRQ